jgi:hypothetical protein
VLSLVFVQLRVAFVTKEASTACSDILHKVKASTDGQLKFQHLYNCIKKSEHSMVPHLLRYPDFRAQATHAWAKVARRVFHVHSCCCFLRACCQPSNPCLLLCCGHVARIVASGRGAFAVSPCGRVGQPRDDDVSSPTLRTHACTSWPAPTHCNFFVVRHGVDDILGNMSGSDWDADAAEALRTTYRGFHGVYWRCVNRVTDKLMQLGEGAYEDKFDEVLRREKAELVRFAHHLAEQKGAAGRSTTTAQLLLAVVFAWWTVSDCKPAVDSMLLATVASSTSALGSPGGGSKNGAAVAVEVDKTYLRQPHAAQVLSLFRLLSMQEVCGHDYVLDPATVDGDGPMAAMFDLDGACHDKPMKLARHMAEIKTGEGACVCGCANASSSSLLLLLLLFSFSFLFSF